MQSIFGKKVKNNVPGRNEIFKGFSGTTEKAFCTFVYESLKKITFNLDELEKSLTGRNICCMVGAVESLKNGNRNLFYHELSDYIKNYGTETPITKSEKMIFMRLYELGEKYFSK